MEHSEMIKVVGLGATVASLFLAATSCDDGNKWCKNDNGFDASARPTGSAVAVEAQKELTHVERLEAECRRLVAEAGRIRGGTRGAWKASCSLCNEICKLPNEEALPLLDRMMEMAIEQPVTNANRSAILGKHEDLFRIVLCSFIASQELRANSFEEWDTFFRFFKKYTDEITVAKRRIKELDQPQTNSYYKYKRFRHLQDLQLYVENLVHNARTVFSDTLSKGLTEEQKSDILRRLDEVEKYTVSPPDSPYSKK